MEPNKIFDLIADGTILASADEDTLIDLNTSGCYNVAQEIFLVDNHGVLIQQISQWLIVVVLPITTLVFLFAGIQAQRTHGCSFDSIVLYLCAFYNCFYLFEDYVACSAPGQLIKVVYVTCMILYLFYHFEIMLTQMEKDITDIRTAKEQNTTSLISLPTINVRGSFTRVSSANTTGPHNESKNQPSRSAWRKCRRPYFWTSILIVIAIMIDAMAELMAGKSLLGDHHWIAMRVLDLVLSISVFLQSKKLENLLDEKEEVFIEHGYAEGRLSSPFIQMRRKQLSLISISYLCANMLVIVELCLLFGMTGPDVANCVRLCAQPYSNGAAALLFILAICHLVPTHLFLYSFYIIPRRFYATEDEHVELASDQSHQMHEPLLKENLLLVEDNINWQTGQRQSSRGSLHGGSSQFQDREESANSLFSGRLSSTKKRIGRNSSYKKRSIDETSSRQNYQVNESKEDLDSSFHRMESMQ